MDKIRIIRTEKAPEAIGAYSQATVCNGILYCSGQIGLDPGTGHMTEGGVRAQTARTMENLKAVVEAGGSSMDRVLKCTVFLTDIADFQAVNEIYGEYFSSGSPAREAVAVKDLPKGALVEISCMAAVSS